MINLDNYDSYFSPSSEMRYLSWFLHRAEDSSRSKAKSYERLDPFSPQKNQLFLYLTKLMNLSDRLRHKIA